MWDDAAVQAASHFVFPVLAADREARDRARDALEDAGIQTTSYPAVHRFTDYRDGAGWSRCRPRGGGRAPLLPARCRRTLEDADLDAIAEEVAKLG